MRSTGDAASSGMGRHIIDVRLRVTSTQAVTDSSRWACARSRSICSGGGAEMIEDVLDQRQRHLACA